MRGGWPTRFSNSSTLNESGKVELGAAPLTFKGAGFDSSPARIQSVLVLPQQRPAPVATERHKGKPGDGNLGKPGKPGDGNLDGNLGTDGTFTHAEARTSSHPLCVG
jgi:hypothetical protein